jgi:hypothetical protein
MIRFLLRCLGYALLASAFVGAVIDGTRSIANGAVQFTPLGSVGFALFKGQYTMLEPAITRYLHPVLWEYVVLPITLAPAFAVALVLGFLLLWAGQRRPQPIGYLARR